MKKNKTVEGIILNIQKKAEKLQIPHPENISPMNLKPENSTEVVHDKIFYEDDSN